MSMTPGVSFLPGSMSGRTQLPLLPTSCEPHVCKQDILALQPMCGRRAVRCALGGEGVATSTLEPSKLSQSQTMRQKERLTNHGPKYRLYIVNDDFNRRERVVEVLLKTVDGLSFASAYASMDEAHKHGKGHVTTVVQELAEHYCEVICGQGVLSVIEPDD
jgi:ATP-dependent Clp protease adaptor protein ClpS